MQQSTTFNKYLLLVHGLDHLAHVTALLLEKRQLLSQHAHLRVQLVPLGLQPGHVLRLVVHYHLQLLDLAQVILKCTTYYNSTSTQYRPSTYQYKLSPFGKMKNLLLVIGTFHVMIFNSCYDLQAIIS